MRIRNPGRGHCERAVSERDGTRGMRISRCSCYADLRFERALHVGDFGREPLNDPQPEWAAVDGDIDPVGWVDGFDMATDRLALVVGLFPRKKRRRNVALGGN